MIKMDKIRVTNLTKRYGKVVAVDSVTLSVREKEFFELQRYGARMARGKGILTEKDVERIVLEDR